MYEAAALNEIFEGLPFLQKEFWSKSEPHSELFDCVAVTMEEKHNVKLVFSNCSVSKHVICQNCKYSYN